MHSFVYSMNIWVFSVNEALLRHWGYSSEQNTQKSLNSLSLQSSGVGEITYKKKKKERVNYILWKKVISDTDKNKLDKRDRK